MAPSFLTQGNDVRSVKPPNLSYSEGQIYYIRQSNLSVVIWIGFVLAACFVALRTWLQFSHNRRFYINDYLISFALLFQLIITILWQIMNPPMYEFEPIDVGVQAPKPSRIYYYNYFLRLEFVITAMWWTALWLVKLAVLTFFWRLFDSVRTHARLFWWAMLAITISTWLVAEFLHIFSCLPVGSFFKLGGCAGTANVYRAKLTFQFGSIADILTDFLIMLVPFPLLRKLQIKKHQKGILVLIFVTPMFPIIFAILRLAKTAVAIGTVDPIRVVLFSAVELAGSIIAASLPSIRLFFLHKQGSSGASGGEYRSYKDWRHETSAEYDRSRDINLVAPLELSNISDAFPAKGSIGAITPVLDPPKDIHVRKDIVIKSYNPPRIGQKVEPLPPAPPPK